MSSPSISMTGPSSLKPTGFAEIILTFTILLAVVCVLSVSLRTWQRIRDRSFYIDDGLTWLGLILTLGLYAVTAWGTTVGIGTPDSMLAMPIMRSAIQVLYWLNVTYLLAMGFTKASICCTLLRINKGTGQRKITWVLWLVMVATGISTLGGFLTFVIRCDRSRGCQDSNKTVSVLQWLVVGVYILVDITLAVVPIFIIRRLNMKKSLKLSTGAILGMGGIACLAAILRIPDQLEEPGETGASNQLYKIGSFVLWSEIETGLGIIACCLPMLRKLLRSFDVDRDLPTSRRPVHYQPGYSGQSGKTPINIRRQPHDSDISTNQEKEPITVLSFISERDSLPPQQSYSANKYVTPGSGARGQHEWLARIPSSNGLFGSHRDVEKAYLHPSAT